MPLQRKTGLQRVSCGKTGIVSKPSPRLKSKRGSSNSKIKASDSATKLTDTVIQAKIKNVYFPSPPKLGSTRLRDKDYSIRYAANWTKISRNCKKLTKFKCCLCSRKAIETHHALYQDAAGLIAGREIPGVHIFPLCAFHHNEAHQPENWIHDYSNPVAKNKTTIAYYSKLLQGWAIALYKNNAGDTTLVGTTSYRRKTGLSTYLR